MMFVDSSGWISVFNVFGRNKAVGAIMAVVAILFTMCAVLSVVLLKMVRLFLLLMKLSVLVTVSYLLTFKLNFNLCFSFFYFIFQVIFLKHVLSIIQLRCFHKAFKMNQINDGDFPKTRIMETPFGLRVPLLLCHRSEKLTE